MNFLIEVFYFNKKNVLRTRVTEQDVFIKKFYEEMLHPFDELL